MGYLTPNKHKIVTRFASLMTENIEMLCPFCPNEETIKADKNKDEIERFPLLAWRETPNVKHTKGVSKHRCLICRETFFVSWLERSKTC